MVVNKCKQQDELLTHELLTEVIDNETRLF